MNQALWVALANNAALLLVLFVIYELSYLISKKRQIQNLLSGVFISAICIAIMSAPFRLSTGVVFDTRSILISVSAMVFGPVPACIAALSAIIYRIFMGGIGTIPENCYHSDKFTCWFDMAKTFFKVTRKSALVACVSNESDCASLHALLHVIIANISKHYRYPRNCTSRDAYLPHHFSGVEHIACSPKRAHQSSKPASNREG